MENLTKAIVSKFKGSRASALVNGRFFEDLAEPKTPYPYIVWLIVSSDDEDTFTEDNENTYVQFSIFSSNSGSVEIKAIYKQLCLLFKGCRLRTVDGDYLKVIKKSLVTNIEDVTTTEGTTTVRHWAVDFEVLTET